MKMHFVYLIFALVIGVICTIVTFRTLYILQKSSGEEACHESDDDFIKLTDDRVARLQRTLSFDTISFSEEHISPDALVKFHKYIEKSFPTIHSSPLVIKEVVNKLSLLYTIRGSNDKLLPMMICAHLDVVPADASMWDYPPFNGTIVDGYLYGRGTIDDKGALVASLEAMEYLLASGFQPKQTIYLAFGHDEEVGGKQGAAHISKLLQDRGIKLDFLIDEGLPNIDNFMPGITVPVATIAPTEKGRIHLRMSVNVTGGHASAPYAESAIGIMSAAVHRLENNPHPNMFGRGPEWQVLEDLAPYLGFPLNVVLSNLWLFSPLVSRILSAKHTTNALVRTTTAVTMFNAGIKVNVIAPSATVTIDHRIHPAQTVQQVLDYDKSVVNDDRITFEVVEKNEPLPQSPYSSDTNSYDGYNRIRRAAKQVWHQDNIALVPGIMVASTDTYHYVPICDAIYRFTAATVDVSELQMIHGVNERIQLKQYERMINFYKHLIKNQKPDTNIHTHTHEL